MPITIDSIIARLGGAEAAARLTGVGTEVLAKMQRGVTRALVNTALVMPADFTRNADLKFPLGSMEQEIGDAVAPGDAEFLDATKLAPMVTYGTNPGMGIPVTGKVRMAIAWYTKRRGR